MTRVSWALAALALAAAIACGGNGTPVGRPGSGGSVSPLPSPASSPTTTAPPGEPTSPGTTPAVRRPPPVTLEPAFPMLRRFDRPTAMVEVPGQGIFLLTTQDGEVYVFEHRRDVGEASLALDWRRHTRRQGNEEGLLGIALDPAFAENRFVYLSYIAAQGERRSVISRFRALGSGAALRLDPASEQVVLEVPQPYSNHNGGQIVFGPDGMLYIGLGDGGSQGDPHGHGQNVGTLLGSILRIDVRQLPYSIPPDNPFVGRAGARGELWAYGFRNPWRFSFDRETGALWAGDVGQNAWEEVDLVRRGANYGWSVMEGPACYRPPSGCDQAGLERPVAAYPLREGNCAVTGGFVYRGSRFPTLRGFYLFADFCSGRIWALDADAVAAGLPVEATVVATTGLGISSFAEDTSGELYALAFDGRVYRVAVRSP